MRDEVIIASTVAGISDPSSVGDIADYVWVVGSQHFHNNNVPNISASGITGAETVNLWKLTAGTWVKVYDGAGNEVQLTATNPQESIFTEGTYGLTKSSGTGITVTASMP